MHSFILHELDWENTGRYLTVSLTILVASFYNFLNLVPSRFIFIVLLAIGMMSKANLQKQFVYSNFYISL